MTESPFQLLKINIVSARDLAPVSRSMHTYVVGWINPNRKLTTRVDYKGNSCPEWNDRFTFKVTPRFLDSDSSTIEIEIYSQAWLRDTLVGSVRVSIVNILPAGNLNGSNRRSVALQIRRPSGRPQGILYAAVSVVDGTMHSMPLSISGVGVPTPPKANDEHNNGTIRRVKSEEFSGSSCSDPESRARKSNGKALEPGPLQGPGSSVGGSMCNSDVGPSASVVAAAVAKGIYEPPNPTMPRVHHGRGRSGGRGLEEDETSILQWEDEPSEEGLITKIERWKMELEKPSRYGYKGKGEPTSNNKDARHNKHNNNNNNNNNNKHRRSKTEGGRVFRCFGKAYGFEFTIVCGGNNGNAKKNKKKVRHISSSDGDMNSRSYIVL